MGATVVPIERQKVRRIAVLRALVLGDLMAATPALRALRAAFPYAQVSLVGLPSQRDFVERLASVDRFIEFPGHPGLPETACNVTALPAFFAAMQDERFDLAVQLHGSGPIVNAIVHRFRARRTAGFYVDGAWVPERDRAFYVRWPQEGRESSRLLALVDHLGLPRQGHAIDFPLRGADVAALDAQWPARQRLRPYVCVHAGAQLPSRRWPSERFAAVADRVAELGRTVVLTGSGGERALVQAVKARMRTAPVDLCGRTTLGSLGALVQGAELVVCNDTGVSHVAAALGTRSVVVSSGADAARWAPVDARRPNGGSQTRHRVLWADAPCRPCAHAVCPTDHRCAREVGTAAVESAVVSLLAWPDTRPGLADVAGPMECA